MATLESELRAARRRLEETNALLAKAEARVEEALAAKERAEKEADAARTALIFHRLSVAFASFEGLLRARCKICEHMGAMHLGGPCAMSHDFGTGPFYDCSCRAFEADVGEKWTVARAFF